MARKTPMKAVETPIVQNCIGCGVLVQRDETNEQNINFFRQEMAERWRLQEEDNKALRASVGVLSASVNTFVIAMQKSNKEFLERVHKLEKNLVYVTITVVVAALAAWGAKLLP
jgi:pantothenate kinase-related protein Tda10